MRTLTPHDRRTLAIVLALLLIFVLLYAWCRPQPRSVEPHVITRAEFGTPTVVGLPLVAGTGDFNFGFGLAIDQLASGQWRLFTSSWSPQYVLEYTLPASLSGTATYVRNLGALDQQGQLFGLFYDKASNRICSSGGSTYDTDASTALTLACAEIDPATQKFKTVVNSAGATVTARRLWMFHDASKPCRVLPAPSATNLDTNVLTFAAPHGLIRGSMVTVATSGGGLNNYGYYYVNAPSTTTLTVHRTYPDAYNNVSAIDLTEPIASAITNCTPRGDRRTMGGIARVPPDLVAALKGELVVGFGGYQSVVSSGDSSMGATACSFNLPAQTFNGTVACTPLLGYKWAQTAGPNFANRDGNYNNTIDWDANPQKGADNVKLYGHGKWVPGDTISQGGFLISKPGGAVFGVIADIQQGCCWYGENYHGLWPTLDEGASVAAVATDLASSTVTFSSSVTWATGAMVQLDTAQSGLLGPPTVYFVRNVGVGQYQFFRSEEEAKTGVLGLVPSATDVTNDRVQFAAPHGIKTQGVVRVETAGGGLEATEYFVNAAFPLALSFHLVRADAAGTIYGQEKNKVNLTAPITSRILATPLTLTAALTTGVRLQSYCARATGSKAALNSQGERHVFYAYDVAKLAAVAAGQAQESVQPESYDNIDFPGFTYPVAGLPGYPRQIIGVQWVPELDRLAIQTPDHTSEKKGRRVAFYPHIALAPPSKPADLSLESAQ